jgi:hypothetical protein
MSQVAKTRIVLDMNSLEGCCMDITRFISIQAAATQQPGRNKLRL